MAELTADQVLQRITKLYDKLTTRRQANAKLLRYFDGKHPLAYATPEWRKLHENRYKDFTDNWCNVVGSAPAEREEVVGFRLSDSESGAMMSSEERQLHTDWEANNLGEQSAQGFLLSTVAKRSGVLVWGDDEDEPVVTWEHPDQYIVDYDPLTRLPRALLKAWTDDDLECATYYLPDYVWKFKRKAVTASATPGQTESGLYVVSNSFTPGATGGWEQRHPEEDDTWPIENPFGEVPFTEYLNRPMLGGEPLSDIDGTIAMQDAINMLWAYLFVAADYASMPARVVLGQEPPKMPVLDESGQKVGEKNVDIEQLTRGRMLWLTGQNTKVDQWEPAKLDVFTNVITLGAKHISAQTRTPIYLIHGELGNINGETLTGLDAPLVSKVRQNHKSFKAPTRRVHRHMAMVRGANDVAKQCMQGVVSWANPETRSDAQVSDAALKDRQVGWPFQAVLERRYGLDATEVARIMKMREVESTDPVTLRLLEAAGGGGAGGAGGG